MEKDSQVLVSGRTILIGQYPSLRKNRKDQRHDSGVYEHPRYVTQTKKSTQPFLTNQNNFSFVFTATTFPSKTMILEETATPAILDENSDTLSKELFGSEPEKSNILLWNVLVQK